MRKRMALLVTLATLCGVVIGSPLASAQEADSLRVYRKLMEDVEKRHAQQIRDLAQQLEALEAEVEAVRRRSETLGTQQRPNIFNPGITVFGNFLARLDDMPVFLEEDEDGAGARIDDKFNLREVELDFRGAIDPWADGVIIAAFESEAPGEYGAEIEEGYFTLKKLPGIDRAPLGLKLKAGRYRPGFGRLNKIHTHDLPWMVSPPSYQTFLGEEGLIRNGVSASIFIPTPGENNTLEATVDVLNDGGLPYDVGQTSGKGAYVAHLKWFWDLADGHDIELGGSGYVEDTSEATLASRLYGIDFTYKWKPFGRGQWRSFLLGGELYVADLPDEIRTDDRPMGLYAWAQYQFARQIYVGARYDHTEIFDEIESPEEELNSLGVFVTYYTTEFLRFRLGYQHAGEEIGQDPSLNTVFLEMNFLFGSHPVEPYWVNR